MKVGQEFKEFLPGRYTLTSLELRAANGFLTILCFPGKEHFLMDYLSSLITDCIGDEWL